MGGLQKSPDKPRRREQYRLAFQRGLLDQPIEELLLDLPRDAAKPNTAIFCEELAARLTIDTPRSIVVRPRPLLRGCGRGSPSN